LNEREEKLTHQEETSRLSRKINLLKRRKREALKHESQQSFEGESSRGKKGNLKGRAPREGAYHHQTEGGKKCGGGPTHGFYMQEKKNGRSHEIRRKEYSHPSSYVRGKVVEGSTVEA